MLERFGEKCGIFGIYSRGSDAARLTHTGIFALQHRGQESSGIVSSDGDQFYSHHGMGLVTQVYKEEDIKKLPGYLAIGHNRYSTSRRSTPEHAQPVILSDKIVALGHNGNLPSTKVLENFLAEKGLPTNHNNDSEMMTSAISYYLRKGSSLEEAIVEAYPLFTGAFSLVVMTPDKLAAVRDPRGIRPLSMGKLNGGYVFASETCSLDAVDAMHLRDVNPGEMIVVDSSGYSSYQIRSGEQKFDIFEFVYFSRPDSKYFGKSVYEIRRNFGNKLAEECLVKADIVVPIPDSAIPAAIGYSRRSGIPLEEALVKNRYIHRTFIEPEQRLRERDVETKLNPICPVIDGQRIAVVDDSIVRSTTIKKIVKMFRRSGASEVHVVIPSPPVKYPDFYGIDTPKQEDLIAARKTTEEIREIIGADSLNYLSYEGMIKATELPENIFSTSCFTGIYPIDIRERAAEITNIN